MQNSYSTGKVSGDDYVGGVCGQNDGTVNGCYNTGEFTGDSNFGGVCGGGNPSTGCYYLSDTSETDFDGIPKNAVEFRNGTVAYLLQEAAKNANATAPQVWGQRIGTDKTPVLNSDSAYTVYHPTLGTSPCKGGYSNTPDGTLNHQYDENGKCFYCGQPEIAYTVTIPASVELGNTVKIEATGVTLPDNKQLNVKVAKDSKFEVTQGDDTRAYTVTKGETTVTPGEPVLTVESSGTGNSVELTFNAPKATTYSGEYKGTVTFTVSVDDNSAS